MTAANIIKEEIRSHIYKLIHLVIFCVIFSQIPEALDCLEKEYLWLILSYLLIKFLLI